jgi:menaquinone-9 beta-reductase
MRTDYDIAIIGGGLAGLATSIQLSRKGYRVIVVEKETYPHHKVCGEYVSLESWNFLLQLGLPLHNLALPRIDTLQLTSPNGKELVTRLPLGGFGISRYLLDSSLAKIAEDNGVQLLQKTKVEDVVFDGNSFHLFLAGREITAKTCCAAYGKRSNLDIKWKRHFIQQNNDRLNNYIGVKYHIKREADENRISLHNFENGYCGLSKIEEDKYCLCYMTKASNLKKSNNSIEEMQQRILFQNPHLKKIFSTGEIVQDFPVTISQISFSEKSKIRNGMLMLGDAAGMITPLCGNGMSIALHTSKLAAGLLDAFLQQKISQSEMESLYQQLWKTNFASRLKTGRMLQSFFGSKMLSNVLVSSFKTFPFLAKPLIRLTHGKPF